MLSKIKSFFFHDFWIPRFLPTLLVFYPIVGTVVAVGMYVKDQSRFGLILDALGFTAMCYGLIIVGAVAAYLIEWKVLQLRSFKEFLIHLWRM